MLDAAIKAITQMFSPPLRAVLWRSVRLALAADRRRRLSVRTVLIGLIEHRQRLGRDHARAARTTPAHAIAWLLSIAASLGIMVGSIFLMPAVTALVASFFADQIGDEVEHEYYPADPPGMALPMALAVVEGCRRRCWRLLVYLCAVPLLLFAGFGAVIFFLATAWHAEPGIFRAGRHAVPAARRGQGAAQAATPRRSIIGGLFIAAFVSIPIVNLATPLFAMAFMVHLHKRLTAAKPVVA